MKKSIIVSILILIVATSTMLNSCYVSQKVAAKSGAQLWSENCARCHNAPAPGEFNNDNWEIAGMHMQVRANITQTDVNKIIDFLKAANN